MFRLSSCSQYRIAKHHADLDMKDEMFERYLRLSRESERLKYRLSQTLPSTLYTDVFNAAGYRRKSASPTSRRSSNATTHNSSTSQSPSLSPSLSHTAAMAQQHLWDARGCPTPPLPGAAPTRGANSHELSDEEALKSVSQQMKAILTELLNCPAVKHDQGLRAWVQERLMDAEHEIRNQKRRRSSAERELKRMR